jgi:hypothetical protein
MTDEGLILRLFYSTILNRDGYIWGEGKDLKGEYMPENKNENHKNFSTASNSATYTNHFSVQFLLMQTLTMLHLPDLNSQNHTMSCM